MPPGCVWSITISLASIAIAVVSILLAARPLQTVERLLSARRVDVSVVRSARLAARKPAQNGLSLEHFAAVRGLGIARLLLA